MNLMAEMKRLTDEITVLQQAWWGVYGALKPPIENVVNTIKAGERIRRVQALQLEYDAL